MVDCQVLTQFNKHVLLDNNRLLLDAKNCDYIIQIPFSTKKCQRKKRTQVESSGMKKMPVKAIYGIIEMQQNPYLTVVTKATVIGQIYHRKVFQVQKIEFICLSQSPSKQDKIYINGLQNIFSSKYFYFSDDYDLTNSLQQFVNAKHSMKNKKIEYMYNSDWVDEFIKVKAYEWITGFISGFVSITFNHGVNNTCEMALISRRDKRRQGMRWLTRGADLDGNTANTVQTELIFSTEVQGNKQIFAHVQLRGSIPFIWSQDPNMKWQPKCTIYPNDKMNIDMMAKNYADIKKSYRNATMINLIDMKKNQKMIGTHFQKYHNQVSDPNMKLIWFDFHAECKNMKYENLAKLLDIINDDLENYGYFSMEIGQSVSDCRLNSKQSSQKGIMRTNCMDCLDRTNVVQSVIARQILLNWLYKLGLQNKPRIVSPFQKLSQTLQQNFRLQWTKNADILSILYSGTPAQKTEFTATGKRTIKGVLKDGYNSIRRFFLGNFFDSRTQDFIDFSLNKLKPKKNPNEKIRHSSFNALYTIFLIVVLVPIAIWYGIDSMVDQNTPGLITYKIAGSTFGVLIATKMVQLMSSLFIRRPMRYNFY